MNEEPGGMGGTQRSVRLWDRCSENGYLPYARILRITLFTATA